MSIIDPRTPVDDVQRFAAEIRSIREQLNTLQSPSGTSAFQAVKKLAARGAWAATSPALTTIPALVGAVPLTWGEPTASLSLEIPALTEGVCLVTVGGIIDLTEQRTDPAAAGSGSLDAHIGLGVNGVAQGFDIDTLRHRITAPSAPGFSSSLISASRTIRRVFEPGTTIELSTHPGWRHTGGSTGSGAILNYSLIVQLVS